MTGKTITDQVQAKYAAVAQSRLGNDVAGVRVVSEAFGYTPEAKGEEPSHGHHVGKPLRGPGARSQDPTRMFIVDELSRVSERCVCEFTEMVGADISTVSKHLAILKNAGLVSDEKRGNQVYYRLRVPCIVEFFQCVESVLACHGEGVGRCRSCS
jgi:ArsR family transcriptional regulator